MAAAPSQPSNPTSLPQTLFRTTGPKPHEDRDCLVCWEPLAETPTIEHVGTADLPGCGRRFHEDCLNSYYREAAQSAATCLLCRAYILNPGETNPWRSDVSPRPSRDHRNDTLRAHWRHWRVVAPRMYVGGSVNNVCAASKKRSLM